MNRKTIEQESLLPKRTVGSALALLLKQGIIQKVPTDIIKEETYRRTGRKADLRETYYETPWGQFMPEMGIGA